MTLSQFISLNESVQQRELSEGVCVGDRSERDYDIYFFQLESFYVEVYYHKKLNLTCRYRAFDNTEELKPYLNKIKIKFRKRKTQ